MAERLGRDADQAEGLRRLFGAAPVRLAPILFDRRGSAAQIAGIVRLAQSIAGCGVRTLVLDAARAQFAAALGLRARFDLLHVQRGECAPAQALLDAGADLGVLPVARAAALAIDTRSDFWSPVAGAARSAFGADLLLLLIESAQARLLAGIGRAEVIVSVPRQRAQWPPLLASLAHVAGMTDIAAFRLLFPAWDTDTAVRLYSDLADACRERLRPELRFGGAVRVARDWMDVARASAQWELACLPRPQIVRTS